MQGIQTQFKALSRTQDKALACYVGPDGKMAVLGLAVGSADRDNVMASFGTPSQGFTGSQGMTGYKSLFDQLQSLVDNPVLVVELPSTSRPQSLKLLVRFMLNQPALLNWLGLGETLLIHLPFHHT